jgi:hypothetical protein
MIDVSKARLGMTREEMKSIFGEPTAVGRGSRKYRTPPVYRYGQIELGFGPYKDSGLDYVMDIGESGEEHSFLLRWTNDTK